ncbi:MAG: hypothetical protein DMD43_07845, partial [Gemmatimonadetes bacterium]
VALAPLGLLEAWAAWRAERALGRLVGKRHDHALLAQRRPGQRWMRAALRLATLGLLALGAAGPEWGREVVRRGANGSDVVLMVDVSASMDARDVPPSRLAEARREALAVIDQLTGSRVAVLAFAGDAVRLCPLTLDRPAARLVVGALSSATLSQPGTDLGRALRTALRLLPAGRREEQAIVLWTDGEDLERGARPAIEEVARANVRVFAVGVGTPAGDAVPVLDEEERVVDVKRDPEGNAVKSRLDEGLMRALARRTHGAYFPATRPGGDMPRLMSALGSVARAGRGQRLVERPVARFPWFAAAAALLLGIERGRLRRRREPRRGEETPLHSERAAAAAAVLLCLLVPSTARAQSYWARGDRAFKAGRFAAAESLYALRLRPGGLGRLFGGLAAPAPVRLNRATAHALKGSGTEADDDLRRLAGRDDRVGNTAGYNLGTLLGQRQEYDPALIELRRVLERDPADAEARWNYEVLLRRRQEERRQSQKPEQRPQPAPAAGGSGGGGAPQARPQAQPRSPQPVAGGEEQTSAGAAGGMSRAQAEQLLNALDELARVEQQRQRKVRAAQEKRGRDW